VPHSSLKVNIIINIIIIIPKIIIAIIIILIIFDVTKRPIGAPLFPIFRYSIDGRP